MVVFTAVAYDDVPPSRFSRNSEDAEAAGVLFTKMFSPNPNFRLRSSTNLGHSGFPEVQNRETSLRNL